MREASLKLIATHKDDTSNLTFHLGGLFESFLCSIVQSANSRLPIETPDRLPRATEWLYRFICGAQGFEPTLLLRSNVMNKNHIQFFHYRNRTRARRVLVIANDSSDGGGVFTIPWSNYELIDAQIGEFRISLSKKLAQQ
jgi:hypothetical protein